VKIKSQWFQGATPKTPQQTASAMAFITWRVAQNMLKQMRTARFDIEIGPQYFAFTGEVLVFLIQVLDRMAYERMDAASRAEFITALVLRVAQVLQENEDSLLGMPLAGELTHSDQFIDLFNQLADRYADFGYGPDGPDFAFMRYFGHRIEAIMPQKDQRWVVDQIMASEVPDALETLQRGMRGVLSTEPRPARAARSRASGD
jgi:Rod binding domain-containing protein